MANKHNTIDYLEFTVTDMAASKQFFAQVFDWEFTDYAPNYAGIKGEDKEVGGLSVGDVKPGGVLIVMYSEDLEQTLSSVTQAGGAITKPIFEFPGGRRFHFTDPSGNELAVWGQPQ